MDLQCLDEDVQFYFQQGLAPSTRKTYRSGIAKFNNFCATYNVVDPLPASESLVCYYITYLAKQKLTYQTIKTYLAALRYLHVANELPPPIRMIEMPKLKMLTRGIQRAQVKDSPPRPRLPITPTILRQIRALWSNHEHEFDYIMLWAAMCMAFFGFFRMGELTIPSQTAFDSSVHLTFGDIAVDSMVNTQSIRVTIKQSKTDQFRTGAQVFLGRTGDKMLCPVAALLAYLAVRQGGDGPLFYYTDGTYLTKDNFIKPVREALNTLGYVSEKFAGHSFRIGAATTAAEAGIDEATIKAMGRWRSDAYQTYVRVPQERMWSISKTLAKQ